MKKHTLIVCTILVTIISLMACTKTASNNPQPTVKKSSIEDLHKTTSPKENTHESTANKNTVSEIDKTVTNKNAYAYIFPNSAIEYISYDDIKSKSNEELRIGRNEIYARHGRIFTSQDLQTYFSSQPWYNGTIQADKFSDALLSTTELYNVQTISSVEFQRKIAETKQSYTYKCVRTESSNGTTSVDPWMKQEKITIQPLDMEHILLTDYELIKNKFYRNGTSFETYIEDFYGEDKTWCTCTFGPKELSLYIDGNDCAWLFEIEK